MSPTPVVQTFIFSIFLNYLLDIIIIYGVPYTTDKDLVVGVLQNSKLVMPTPISRPHNFLSFLVHNLFKKQECFSALCRATSILFH